MRLLIEYNVCVYTLFLFNGNEHENHHAVMQNFKYETFHSLCLSFVHVAHRFECLPIQLYGIAHVCKS